MITIWIVNRQAATLTLTRIARADLHRYRRVRALSDGQWFDAYEVA